MLKGRARCSNEYLWLINYDLSCITVITILLLLWKFPFIQPALLFNQRGTCTNVTGLDGAFHTFIGLQH